MELMTLLLWHVLMWVLLLVLVMLLRLQSFLPKDLPLEARPSVLVTAKEHCRAV